MAFPLYIASCTRHNGITYLTVVGHGLTAGNEGQTIQIVGCPDKSVNVTAKVFKVIQPDTIRFLQPGLPDIHAAVTGGAIAVG